MPFAIPYAVRTYFFFRFYSAYKKMKVVVLRTGANCVEKKNFITHEWKFRIKFNYTWITFFFSKLMLNIQNRGYRMEYVTKTSLSISVVRFYSSTSYILKFSFTFLMSAMTGEISCSNALHEKYFQKNQVLLESTSVGN